MALSEYISELESLIHKKDRLVNHIKYPDKLLTVLRELDALAEMKKAKMEVVKKIKTWLVSHLSGKPIKGHMLHTVIYGPPGVGKTSLGIALAKVWSAMGLIKQPAVKPKNTKEDTVKVLEELASKNKVQIQKFKTQARKHLDLVRNIRHNTGRVEKIKHRSNQYGYIDKILSNVEEILEDLREYEDDEDLDKVEDTTDEIPFVIANKSDLVGKYVGWTAPKTRDFFNKHRGKVIFIDEAYKLLISKSSSGFCSFGMEALTEIIQMMSEDPDDWILQFAGYKRMLEETIFAAQEGFDRRISQFYHIEDYSPSGLATVFKYQLKKDGWSLSPDATNNLESFFAANKDYFGAFGGDTEKLALYAKEIYSTVKYDEAKEGLTAFEPIITMAMIEEALKVLKDNKVGNDKDKAPPPGLYI